MGEGWDGRWGLGALNWLLLCEWRETRGSREQLEGRDAGKIDFFNRPSWSMLLLCFVQLYHDSDCAPRTSSVYLCDQNTPD